MSDPRVFFAAERTLLAWIRSGLTIMGFGFVVARFGLFLRVIEAQGTGVAVRFSGHPRISNSLGVALVLLGVTCMIVPAYQHRLYVKRLPSEDLPAGRTLDFPVVVALMLGTLGIVLAVYLTL